MWILESINFACVQCGSLTNPFISESVHVWVNVCVYLSGITHSFQTCLSSTLVCVRECVHVCTSECEIPLSVLKPLSGLLPVWRGRRPTHRHARSCHTCMCVCFVMQASVYVSACGYGRASAFGEELYRVMVVIFR